MAEITDEKQYTMTRSDYISKVSQVINKIISEFTKQFLEDLEDGNVDNPIKQSSLLFAESLYLNPQPHRIFTNTRKPNPIARHYGIGLFKGPFHMDLKEIKIEKVLKDHLNVDLV